MLVSAGTAKVVPARRKMVDAIRTIIEDGCILVLELGCRDYPGITYSPVNSHCAYSLLIMVL